MDFTLQPDDAKWVNEMIVSVTDEMRKTTPIARVFVETVQTVLEREKNWVSKPRRAYQLILTKKFVLDSLEERLMQSIRQSTTSCVS